jgi:hypothetical protein
MKHASRPKWPAGLGAALLGATVALAQQPALRITSPLSGAVITAGQTITITVSADPSVRVAGVLTDGPFPDLQPGPSQNEFLQKIPPTIPPGTYRLTAIGLTSTGDLESSPVPIDIEPADPNSITASSPVFNFTAIGHKLPIEVKGHYTDGSTLDLTKSSRISFISKDPQVAIVDSTGMVKAVGLGQTSILIRYEGSASRYAAIYVQVRQPVPTEEQ